MKFSLLKKFAFLMVLFFLLTPSFTKGITIINPLKVETFEELIDAIIDFVFWVAIAIAPIMIIAAAFYFLTSGGDPEKLRTAKKIILYTFIGLFIVLLAKGIPDIIKQILEGGSPPPATCTPNGCNGNCPAYCTVAEDPDCGCQSNNGCCGIGCNNLNDNNCSLTCDLIEKLGDSNNDCVINVLDAANLKDINQDGVVNSCDATFLSNVSFGLKNGDLLTSTLVSKLGDSNDDCLININDATNLKDINQDGVVNSCDATLLQNVTWGFRCTVL